MRSLAFAVAVLASCRAADAAAQRPDAADPPPAGTLVFEAVPLAHASAQDIAAALTELVRASEKAAALRGVANGSCVLYPPGALLPRPKPRSPFLADRRTNSILVHAAPNDLLRIRELITRLDVEGFRVGR